MKRLILTFLILAFAVSVHAEPDKWLIDGNGKRATIIKQDRWESDKYQILDSSGKQIGTIEQDRWEPDKWNIIRDGKHTGVIEKDRWEPDRWNVENIDSVKKSGIN